MYSRLVIREGFDKLTDGLTCCHLREYIRENGKFDLAIGYGLGRERGQAESNAIDAGKESRIRGNQRSYLFCEDRKLIGLYGQGNDFSIEGPVTPYMREIADQTGLSTLTVQKLMAAFRITGTEEVTTLELSRVLHVTIRSGQPPAFPLGKISVGTATLLPSNQYQGTAQQGVPDSA